MQIITLFSGITTNTTIAPDKQVDSGNVPARPSRTYEARVTGTGVITATITFFGSNDGVGYSATPFGTITLSGSTSVTDGFMSQANWQFVRCVTSNVTGTGATVSSTVAL